MGFGTPYLLEGVPPKGLLFQTALARTAEDRAKVDLKLHFMPKTLVEVVIFIKFQCCLDFDMVTAGASNTKPPGCLLILQDKRYKRTRRDLLLEQYVENSKGGGLGQTAAGFKVDGIIASAAARRRQLLLGL